MSASGTRLSWHQGLPLLELPEVKTHYELGFAQGRCMGQLIRARCADCHALHKVLPYIATPPGAALFNQLREQHTRLFPGYMQEIEGLAAGTGLPFEKLFALNLRNELLAAADADAAARSAAPAVAAVISPPDLDTAAGCSDVLVVLDAADPPLEWVDVALPTSPRFAKEQSVGETAGGPSLLARLRAMGTRVADQAAKSLASQRAKLEAARTHFKAQHGPVAPHCDQVMQQESQDTVQACEADAEVDQDKPNVGGAQAQAAGGNVCTASVPTEANAIGSCNQRPGSATNTPDLDLGVKQVAAGTEVSSSAQGCLLGHNEDSASDAVGRMYLIKTSMAEQGHTWCALCYPGELPSTAFGINTAGLAYTLDALYPAQAHLPGVGRNFLSRALLDATTIDEARALLCTPGQATGRSVNLLDLNNCQLENVEVAPGGICDILPIKPGGWLFHANAYQRMPHIKEKAGQSSVHREQAASKYPRPITPTQVLEVLGDETDDEWPIFRLGAGPDTALTAVSLILQCSHSGPATVRLLSDNPRTGNTLLVLDGHSLQVKDASCW